MNLCVCSDTRSRSGSFFAAATAGFFGAMLNKNAPVRGGVNIILMRSVGHD